MTNDPHRPDATAAPPRHGFALLSLALAVLIAAVLQFAAAAKVAHGADVLRRMKDAALLKEGGLPTTFNPADYQFLVQPDAAFTGGVPLDFLIAAGEFALVVLILLAHRTRALWLLVALVFASFAGYALQRLLAELPCGCFGDLWQPPGAVSFGLDIAFVLGAFGIACLRRTPKPLLLATLALALAGARAGYVYAANTAPDREATPGAETANAPHQDAPAPDRTEQTPPPNPGAAPPLDLSTPPERKLLDSDLMADVREAHAAGDPTVYYVFIWDPTCTTCERYLPIVQHYQRTYAEEGDIYLQILDFQKKDLLDRLGIRDYEWESSPTVFLVRDGEIIAQPGGEEAPLPDKVHDKVEAGEPLTDD